MKNCIVLCSLHTVERLNDILHLTEKCKLDIAFSLNDKHKTNKKLTRLLSRKPFVVDVTYHSNYGVDIAPFLQQLVRINHRQYPFFIKIHSKQSFWGVKNHVDWGSVLIDSLIGDKIFCEKNLQILSKDKIGMIGPSSFRMNKQYGHHYDKICKVCNQLNIATKNLDRYGFIAGTMFMSKTQLMQKYLAKDIEYLDSLLINEIGKVDDLYYTNGTYCHSMERIFGYIIHHENKKIHQTVLKTIKIYNAKYRVLHLHIAYNNLCYITEDVNIYGRILRQSSDSIEIQWLHLNNDPVVKYWIWNENKSTLSTSLAKIK